MTLIQHAEKNCLFCSIMAGTIPSAKVFENDSFFAFLDINPSAKGHSLLVPKYHAETVLQLPAEYGASLLDATKIIGNAIMQETGATGFNCIQNNFTSAGQVIFHVHWHIIPRFDNDGLFGVPHEKYTSDDEMTHLARAIADRTL